MVNARRLANHLSEDVGKLGFRGTICNGEAKWEHAKLGHAPPIWFVFSGAGPLLSHVFFALYSKLCTLATMAFLASLAKTGIQGNADVTGAHR